MNRRNLRCTVCALRVTNLSNPLEFLQFGVVRRLGGSCDGRRWSLRALGYEK